jgi:hypothetical protein
MFKRRQFLLFAIAFVIFIATDMAEAATIGTRLFTRYVPADCITPNTVTRFITAESRIYLWFYVTDAAVGDVAMTEWYQPDGTYWGSAQAGPTSWSGTGCFYPGQNVSTSQMSSLPGNWTVKVYYNGTYVFTLSFTLAYPQEIALGQDINGYLQSASARSPERGNEFYSDFYRFYAAAGSQVVIAANANYFDTYIYLLHNGDTIQYDDDGGGGTNSRIPAYSGSFVIPASAYYVVEVTSFYANTEGAYALTVSGGALPSMTRLVIGQPANGRLDTSDSRSRFRTERYADLYVFSGNQNQRIAIDLSSTDFDTYLYLMDSSFNRLFENDDVTSNNRNSRIPNPSGYYTLSYVGDYYVEVTSYGRNVTGNYQVVVAQTVDSTITLFESRGSGSPITWLGPNQSRFYADSNGGTHTYHLFAFANNNQSIDVTQFWLKIQEENSGSRLTISVPSGGAPNDKLSGGSVQILLPFGITVTNITGANANLGGTQGNQSAIKDLFPCEFNALLWSAIGKIVKIGTGYEFLDIECIGTAVKEAVKYAFTIQGAGDLCDVTYPIINVASNMCLSDPGNNSLFGEKALNTHQIRSVVWKPEAAGLNASYVILHFAESTNNVMDLIGIKGITVHVATPRGDLLLDNYK